MCQIASAAHRWVKACDRRKLSRRRKVVVAQRVKAIVGVFIRNDCDSWKTYSGMSDVKGLRHSDKTMCLAFYTARNDKRGHAESSA
jgi:hypothetical protein